MARAADDGVGWSPELVKPAGSLQPVKPPRSLGAAWGHGASGRQGELQAWFAGGTRQPPESLGQPDVESAVTQVTHFIFLP